MAEDNAAAETAASEMPTPKIKHDWYQTDSHVVVTILAKNSENVRVSYTETSLSVSANLPSGNDYSLEIDLAHHIVPDQCSYKVLPSKIEVKLKHRDCIRWSSLEGTPSEQEAVQPIPQDSYCFDHTEILQASDDPAKYPTSSKKVRDWNKVEKEIEKEEAAEEPEGNAALIALFQKIYNSGSDEVRRAMNKSYQESAGTVLSTNWSEVGSAKVNKKPPGGVEWKTWDS